MKSQMNLKRYNTYIYKQFIYKDIKYNKGEKIKYG
jgi:hypothetical protein